jgi:hypothetical protein
VRAYAAVTAEAASPLRGILCSIPENTSQECATEKYFKDVLAAVSFRESCGVTPLRINLLPQSRLFVSNARLEVKVLRFDGCVGYAQPIHRQFLARFHLDLESDGGGDPSLKLGESKPRSNFRSEVLAAFDRSHENGLAHPLGIVRSNFEAVSSMLPDCDGPFH